MKIGGAEDIRNVQARDWQRFGKGVALPWEQVRVWLLELMAAVRRFVPPTVDACAKAYGESEVYSSISLVIERRSGQLDRELSRNVR